MSHSDFEDRDDDVVPSDNSTARSPISGSIETATKALSEMLSDPFADSRRCEGVLVAVFGDERIPMILGHRAIREAAKDWKRFSSDAPFRVPIPSEERVRSVRQYPIEADPPVHTAFREILKPFFLRPVRPDYVAAIDSLIVQMLDEAARRPQVEIVREFALPLQSRALAQLMKMPLQAADEWIGWGTHVFRDGNDEAGKGSALERYIHRTIENAASRTGNDFFVALHAMQIDGRHLTLHEMIGIANLVFAGGRDTIINAVTFVIGYFAQDRAALAAASRSERSIAMATEEFVRVISPLTHIGRICTASERLGDCDVDVGERVSLCWASANFDESVFDDPRTINLDRSSNPHLGFGSGVHNCLGAAQARTILRGVIRQLARRTDAVEILAAEPQFEETENFRRRLGYRSLEVRIHGKRKG